MLISWAFFPSPICILSRFRGCRFSWFGSSVSHDRIKPDLIAKKKNSGPLTGFNLLTVLTSLNQFCNQFFDILDRLKN